jgi:hypothetical protein
MKLKAIVKETAAMEEEEEEEDSVPRGEEERSRIHHARSATRHSWRL